MVGDGEYFVVELPDEARLVQPIPRGAKHPINFGREVTRAPSLCVPPAMYASSMDGSG